MTQEPTDDTKLRAGSEALDNASSVTPAETSPFPIVGIGASAGGLASFLQKPFSRNDLATKLRALLD